jgi:hypothetical protein
MKLSPVSVLVGALLATGALWYAKGTDLVPALEMIGTWALVGVIWWEVRALLVQHAAELKQYRAESFRMIFERMQDGEVRKARSILLSAWRKGMLHPDSWPPELRNAAEVASSHYDELGLLVQAGGVDEDLLFPAFAASVADCWQAARPLIKHQREAYQDPGRWKAFETLAGTAASCRKPVLGDLAARRLAGDPPT